MLMIAIEMLIAADTLLRIKETIERPFIFFLQYYYADQYDNDLQNHCDIRHSCH